MSLMMFSSSKETLKKFLFSINVSVEINMQNGMIQGILKIFFAMKATGDK